MHQSALLSHFLREASLCCGWEVRNAESQTDQSAQGKCLWSVQSQMEHQSLTLSPRLRDHRERKGRQIIKARDQGRME